MSSAVLLSKGRCAEIRSVLLNKLLNKNGLDVRLGGGEALNLFILLLSGMCLAEQNRTHLSKLMGLSSFQELTL